MGLSETIVRFIVLIQRRATKNAGEIQRENLFFIFIRNACVYVCMCICIYVCLYMYIYPDPDPESPIPEARPDPEGSG